MFFKSINRRYASVNVTAKKLWMVRRQTEIFIAILKNRLLIYYYRFIHN